MRKNLILIFLFNYFINFLFKLNKKNLFEINLFSFFLSLFSSLSLFTEMEKKYNLSPISAKEIDENYMKNEKIIIKDSTEKLWNDIINLIRTKSRCNNDTIVILDSEVKFKNQIIASSSMFGKESIICYEKCDFETIFSELKKEFGKNCIYKADTWWKFTYFVKQKFANEMDENELVFRNDFINEMIKKLQYDDEIIRIDRKLYGQMYATFLNEFKTLFGQDSIQMKDNDDYYDVVCGYSTIISFSASTELIKNINLSNLLVKLPK